MFETRYYQADAEYAIYNYFASGGTGNPICAMPTGCHDKNTKVMMYDGSVKLIENVQVGDQLMGPDSKPRNVLNLARGRQQMARIIPVKGNSFVVNIGHVLSLKTTQEKSEENHVHGNLEKGQLNSISVENYLEKTKWYKHTRKLWKPEIINFDKNYNFKIFPYHMGILLGDGSISNSISITTMDFEIEKEIRILANQFNLEIRENKKINNKAIGYVLSAGKASNGKGLYKNELINTLYNLGLRECVADNKFIPKEYKIANQNQRLEILAGLIDTDGSLSSGGYDFVSKSKQLADDVVFISRSLGFAAYVKSCQKSCQTGAIGTYYRVYISGDINKIPVKLERKKAKIRLQKKSVLVTGFSVKLLPEDDFYGFALDSDHLYLTDDFTVHHNTGKSVVIGNFLRNLFHAWPNQRVMMLTHVKELISQNAEKLQKIWPTAPIGIYSAGLHSRDTIMPILFGGVQSVAKHIKRCQNENHLPANMRHFGWRDLLIIDECHLLSPDEDTMYQFVIAELKKINPHLKVIGFTATHYRLKQGMLTDEGLFTDICYDITGVEAFNRLIAEGYISPLIPRPTSTRIDLSEVGLLGSDFNLKQLESAVDKDEITFSAVKEMVEYGHDRLCWLVFASGIDNAEHIAAMLQSFGISSAAVHSKLPSGENDKRIYAHKMGEIRALVNNNKLTTGYDNPPIDMIGMLRPTMSPGLWVQMLGRGTRPSPATGKRNCLVLDFAGNTPRLGPINDPVKPRKPGKGGGDAPIRICENCGVYNHAAARYCCNCGIEFKFETKLFKSAGDAPLLRSDLPVTEYFDVKRVIYNLHQKEGSPPSIKVSYFCNLQMFNEWVCLEHSGLASKKARDWWRQRHQSEPPVTTHEALRKVSELRIPTKIRVWTNKKHPEILSHEY